jgi:hypothetical protein
MALKIWIRLTVAGADSAYRRWFVAVHVFESS